MARRLSSIFSMGSNSSDATSNGSRPRSAFNPDYPASDHLPSAQLTSPKSTPDLRPSTPSSRFQDAQQLYTARRTPPIDTSRPSPRFGPLTSPLPSLEEDGGLPSPLFLRKPVPQQAASPVSSRPVSRNSGPGSSASSRDGTRPQSRTASPAKLRPNTPTSEQSKLSKRRTWLPGSKGKPGSEDSDISGMSGSASWIITPRQQDSLRYDLVPLANFQKVKVSIQARLL